MDFDEYLQNKRKIKFSLGQALDSLDKTKQELFNFREATGEALNHVDSKKERLGKMMSLINDLPEEPQYVEPDEVSAVLPSASYISNIMAKNAYHEHELIRDSATNFVQIQSTTEVGVSAFATMDLIVFKIGEAISGNYPEMAEVLADYSLPTASEKRLEIETWLMSFNPLLGEKYKEAYQNLTDKEFMSAAHAMRDMLSQLLQTLAPDEKVKQVDWYIPESNTHGPTQRQRIKFSVLGFNPQDQIDKLDLETVELLSVEGRFIFKNLSSEAHRREGKWEEITVASYIATCQSVIEQIKILRERFYKKNE